MAPAGSAGGLEVRGRRPRTGRQVRSPAQVTGGPYKGPLFFMVGLETEEPPSKGEEKGPGWPRQAPQAAWKSEAGGRGLEGKSDRRHK